MCGLIFFQIFFQIFYRLKAVPTIEYAPIFLSHLFAQVEPMFGFLQVLFLAFEYLDCSENRTPIHSATPHAAATGVRCTCGSGMAITWSATRSVSCSYSSFGWPMVSLACVPVERSMRPISARFAPVELTPSGGGHTAVYCAPLVPIDSRLSQRFYLITSQL